MAERLSGIAFALTLALGLSAQAAAPALKYLFPAGGMRGSTVQVTLSGKFEGANRWIWASHPGLTVMPGDKPDQVTVTIAKDAPLGPQLLRLVNAEGNSAPRWFSIGALPTLADTEPNDALGKEQVIEKLPVTVDGKLDKRGTADLFAFTLSQGQTLTAVVEAYSLGSPIDAALELRDASGLTVATAHDARSLDPSLIHTVAKAGRYSLQLAGFTHPPAADVSFTGGADVIYRLHLSTGPITHGLKSPLVSTTGKTTVQLDGVGLPEKEKAFVVEPGMLRAATPVQSLSLPHAITAHQVAVVDHAIDQETEPNNVPAQAQPLAVPGAIAGEISAAGDSDLYAFRATKGKSYVLTAMSMQLGLPLDAKLAVLDLAGKEITSADAGGVAEDSRFSFKAAADGIYLAKVTDLFGGGGPDLDYMLRLTPSDEILTTTVGSGTDYVLAAGKTVDIKGKLSAPFGYSGELVARVHGLPSDVHATEVAAVKKNNQEFTLTLKAAPDAAASQTPITVTLWATDPKLPWRRVPATASLRGENQRLTTLLDDTPLFFLSVQPSPHVAIKVDTPAPARSELTVKKP
jgi:hypothetical protein